MTCEIQSARRGSFRKDFQNRDTLHLPCALNGRTHFSELNQNTNINRLECYWFKPVPLKAQEKVILVYMPFRIPKTNIGWDRWHGPLAAAFRLFLCSVLLSLSFQCIHVSGELRFSSKNKLLWEFPVHGISFHHTTSCLIIVHLLTIDSGRILFSQQREVHHLTILPCKKPSNSNLFPSKIQSMKKREFVSVLTRSL